MSYALDLTVKERWKEVIFVRFHTAVTARNDTRRSGSLLVLRTPFGLESAGLIGNVKGLGQHSSGKQSDLVLLTTDRLVGDDDFTVTLLRFWIGEDNDTQQSGMRGISVPLTPHQQLARIWLHDFVFNVFISQRLRAGLSGNLPLWNR
jgi:hypothetical protein